MQVVWSGHWGVRMIRGRYQRRQDARLVEPCEVKSLSRVRLFATPWTVAYQASPSMGFSRQEYWSGLQFPSPGDLSEPGTLHVIKRTLAFVLSDKRSQWGDFEQTHVSERCF